MIKYNSFSWKNDLQLQKTTKTTAKDAIQNKSKPSTDAILSIWGIDKTSVPPPMLEKILNNNVFLNS